ncbi:MAG: 30S ribosomal protein S11 [bacterium]|nr:30S ribosomal protein S11 [bacterium]
MATVSKTTKRSVSNGRVYITATFNNTLVTITDTSGNTISWGSAGAAGFKGARKSTPFAATTAVDQTIRKAMDIGLREVDVFIKGPGAGRDGAIRALKAAGMAILSIADVTPLAHNGCRPKKKRRV